MRTIILSAGHSLADPGAVYSGAKESFMTMELVKVAAEVLRKHGIGVLTVPDNLNLVDTIKWVNGRAAESAIELCLEIHTNASTDTSARGVEAWYYHDFNTGKSDEKSKKLSQCLVDAIVVESSIPSRGVYDESTNHWGRLGFVHDTKPLAALVECGFLSNETDRNILLSDNGRNNIGKGIARGILAYMGEAWRPELLVTGSAPVDTKQKEIDDLKSQLAATVKNRDYEINKVREEYSKKLNDLKINLQNIVNDI